jgi:hypothetical protein
MPENAMHSSSEGIVIRNADNEDIRTFNTLMNNNGGAVFFRATFGQFNFSTMVETSVISLVAHATEDESMLGYISVTDSPLIGKEGDAFDRYIKSLQSFMPDANNINTLFINFLLLDENPNYDTDLVGSDLLKNVFEECADTDYVFWLCPKSVKLTYWTEKVWSLIDTSAESESKSEEHEHPFSGYMLLYVHRRDFCPKLLVRQARMEDNDDLLPILQESYPDVVEGQGDYFIADLISAQDEQSSFYTGVHKNVPVSLLVTSTDVNVNLIRKVFDIDRFSDIFIEKERSPPPPPLRINILGDIRSITKEAMCLLMKNNNCLFLDVETMKGLPSTTNEEKKAESEADAASQDLALATQAVEMVDKEISDMVSKAMANTTHDDAYIPFVVIQGFPRTDAESSLIAQNKIHFDMVIDIRNESEDYEVEDEDTFLVSHLEAVEALGTFVGTPGADADSDLVMPSYWQNVAIGGHDATSEEELGQIFTSIVNARVAELSDIAAKEADEPPFANAFAITSFCMKADFVSRSDDLLRIAFEEYPQLDYCLFLMPNNSVLSDTVSSKLVRSMVKVNLRLGVSFDQTLFIMHRDYYLCKSDLFSVNRMDESNETAVRSFLAPLDEAESQSAIACSIDGIKCNDLDLKDNPTSVSFAVNLGQDLVGIVCISRKYIGNDDINWIRSNYKIEEEVNFDRHRARTQAYVTKFLMSPAFSCAARYVIREIMRKAIKSLLYYQDRKDVTPPQEIMDNMLPVMPRRRMQASDVVNVPLRIRPSEGPGADCPMYYLTKKQINTPKRMNLQRLVIVGGSSASYAFLEKICYLKDINMSNIYFISDMVPASFKLASDSKGGDKDVNSGTVFSEAYSDSITGCLSPEDADDPTLEELYSLGFGHRVNLIRGRLTEIDRKSKAVVVSDEMIVEYDVLVISTTTNDKSYMRWPTTAKMHVSRCELAGIFGIGDAYTDAKALEWMRMTGQDKAKWPIVVYGTGIDLLVAVGKLATLGIPSRRLTVVMPRDELPENAHANINEVLIRSLRSSGVVIHRGWDISDVELSPNSKVENVTIKKLDAELTAGGEEYAANTQILPCFSLICCESKNCDPDVFTAINESGIVYDGRIVVDKDFCTVDPYVYAVSDNTRFSRVHTKSLSHNFRNAQEIGAYAASVVLNKHYHAKVESVPDMYSIAQGAVPGFMKPKSQYGAIAGPRYYFNSKLNEELHNCQVLLTGDLQSDRMCALKVDSYGVVVEIAYVGRNPIEARNLSKLVGLHESYLNAAMHMYEQDKVPDWIDFFRNTWATAIYHDKFMDFIEMVHTMLSSDKGTYDVLDRVSDALESSTENDILLETWMKEIGPRGEKLDANTKRIVETQTIDYLRSNRHMIDRFYIPLRKKEK